MNADERFWAVIPAAGTGSRFGGETPKQYLPLAGRTVIEWSLEPFLAEPAVAGIMVAVAAGDRRFESLGVRASKPVWTAIGGAARWQSVRRALDVLVANGAQRDDWVLVHDAARPCLAGADLRRLMDALRQDAVGGLLAVAGPDTLKRADADGRVDSTLDRRGIWRAQTPQMFRLGSLVVALDAAAGEVTDEAAAMEATGARPRLVSGSPANLKITTREDLELAECLMRRRAAL